MFSKSIILFQTIETVELDDHRKMLKRYKDKCQKLWNIVKNRKCGQIMFFLLKYKYLLETELRSVLIFLLKCKYFSEPNWNWFGKVIKKSIPKMPNQTGIGSEKVLKFFRIFFEPNWNRFGNRHWIKCKGHFPHKFGFLAWCQMADTCQNIYGGFWGIWTLH